MTSQSYLFSSLSVRLIVVLWSKNIRQHLGNKTVTDSVITSESVGFDFLTSEWPDLPDIANADNYLRETALANDPPSKTLYYRR